MGVDRYVLDFLTKYATASEAPLGETLCLGRQNLNVDQTVGNDILRRYMDEEAASKMPWGERYSEKLLQFLGATTVTSLDYSNYEGAELVSDLNKPVPPEFHDRFDCIIDGGTIEHVYNVPMAFENVSAMLRVGGVFILVDAANNQLGHGMYQFSPELLYSAFSEANGFNIVSMEIYELNGHPAGLPCSNPRVVGHRVEIGRTKFAAYVMMAAVKTRETESIAAQQLDYELAWKRGKRP